jgi:hypothetical protein
MAMSRKTRPALLGLVWTPLPDSKKASRRCRGPNVPNFRQAFGGRLSAGEGISALAPTEGLVDNGVHVDR